LVASIDVCWSGQYDYGLSMPFPHGFLGNQTIHEAYGIQQSRSIPDVQERAALSSLAFSTFLAGGFVANSLEIMAREAHDRATPT
jgi:hypothetical protein